ncbi:MAG: hypothetical protein KDE56_12830 [Anaerolineales bacterium]|nr:hypothetical protein [Anaerolineales bacterium]
MLPYILMAALFLFLAILAAVESSFSSLSLLPWFNGMVWLRVHLITLGAMTQMLFGALPLLTAVRHRLPRPATRWDIWLTLNAGILALLVGIPLVNRVPIIMGGTLVFIATVLLIGQLLKLRQAAPANESKAEGMGNGRKFYIAGLGYFLLGILVGTGLWSGWVGPLGIVGKAVEVHIHANSWGLMSLVFAGLLVDLYPVWAKRPFANPKAITPIFWMMTLGAFGLVFGPWFANTYLLVPGLLLHLAATVWLLVNIIKPLWGDWPAWTAGLAHLIVAYFWILAPILMAPFVLFEIPGVPGPTIEATAPQALIYGWMLQFGFAILPYFFTRILLPDRPAQLGGTWFSFAFINLGSLFLWTSIFISSTQPILHGLAYLLWVIALLPIVNQLWRIIRTGLARLERDVTPEGETHVLV